MDDDHVVAGGRPLRIFDVIENFAGRASTERDSGQSSCASKSAVEGGVETDRKLAALGNGKQLGVVEAQFAGAAVIHASHVELLLAAVPGSAVNDTAVGSEAGVADRAGAESDLLIIRRSSGTSAVTDPPAKSECCGRHHDYCRRGCDQSTRVCRLYLLHGCLCA